MIYRFIYTLLLLIPAAPVDAQQPDIISLLKKIETAQNDSLKIGFFRSIIEAYAETKPDSSVYFSEQLLTCARKLNLKLIEVYALDELGYAYMNLGDYPRSLRTLLSAIEIAEDPKSERNVLAEKYLDQKMYLLHPVTPQMLRLGFLARGYQILGVLYANNNDNAKGITYHLQALQFAEPSGDVRALCETYLTLGRLHLFSKKTDSALIYEQKAFDISIKTGYNKYVGSILLNLGRIYLETGNKQLAAVYFRKAVDENIRQNYLRGVVAGYLLLATLYNQPATRDSGLYFSNAALDAAKYLNFPDLLLRSYTSLAALYRLNKNNDSAVKYQALIIKMNDSLSNSKRDQQFQSIGFNEQQRKQEIEAAKRAYQNRLQIYLLLIGLVVFLLIAILLWRNNRQRKKSNAILQQQKNELEVALDELKSAQSQLIQREKMASLGELTAGIAHEIQNPLNFVNNFSDVNKEMLEELKAERLKPASERDEQTESEIIENVIVNSEKINHHGKRADAIVKGMLQHSRTSTGIKEPTDINKLADEYLRLSYHGLRAKDKEFSAEIKTDFDVTVDLIKVVPHDIGRVLLNLYNNAFYAVSEKKKHQAENYEPIVSIKTKSLDGRVEVSVKDNGNGIPQNIVDKIFQPFFTTKPTGQGTGLGLSLSYDIVKAHGGEIKVESKEGEGAAFAIYLPVS
ncbi:hypothetical protein BH10BAC2_BH10BAC2_42270 [soil metagenome]